MVFLERIEKIFLRVPEIKRSFELVLNSSLKFFSSVKRDWKGGRLKRAARLEFLLVVSSHF